MANGKLGNAAPAATTNTTIFQVSSGKVATFNLGIANMTTTDVTFRVAISATATPTSAEYIEYNVTLPPNGVFERWALVASASEYVVVYASKVGLAVRAWGFEQ